MTPEERLHGEIEEQYYDAYLAKERLHLHEDWITFEEYYQAEQNPPEDANDPASITPIIPPIIDSLVADLVSPPVEILLTGHTRSEEPFAPKAQRALKWVWRRNRMDYKRDDFEYNREKFGTGIWKVYFDGSVSAVGMPIIESISPFNFFPDPRIRDARALHTGEYIIHAVPRSIHYLQRVYGPKADQIRPAYQTLTSADPDMHDELALLPPTAQQVLLLERWTIERDGRLRKVVTVVGQPIILFDSDEIDEEEQLRRGYLQLDRFPFVVVPCYKRHGSLWGTGDIQRLRPVQDLINDLDDQIRLNARLTGNMQYIVGINSGIDPYLWTNEPGLKIPARLVDDWRPVQPGNLPPFIENRRIQAITLEAEMISGRTDVVEGRRPGSLRAASAILALQEAAAKRINHKRMNTRWGLEEVFSIILDYVTHEWTEEVEIGEELMFRGEDIKTIEMLKEDGDLEKAEQLEQELLSGSLFRGTDLLQIPELDVMGRPTGDTKRAEFDITVNVGEGMPQSRAFLYQAVIEGLQFGLVTREEARLVMKDALNFPYIEPFMPTGEFVGGGAQMGTSMTQPDQTQQVLDLLMGGLAMGDPGGQGMPMPMI